MGDTAVDKMERNRIVLDIRRYHVDTICGNLFREIEHLLPSDIHSDVHSALHESIFRNGTMLINDREAEALGLEPKDREGWTASDRLANELKVKELMMAPLLSGMHLMEDSK